MTEVCLSDNPDSLMAHKPNVVCVCEIERERERVAPKRKLWEISLLPVMYH